MAGAQGAAGTGTFVDPAPVESARKRTKKLGNGYPVVESTGWQTLAAWAVDFGVVSLVAAAVTAAVAVSLSGSAGKTAAAAVAAG